MFSKILIANRGEIAARIIRTAREMNIRTAAVYSDCDRPALHVRLADEAYCLGPSPSVESYLDMNKILQAAEASGRKPSIPATAFWPKTPNLPAVADNRGFASLALRLKPWI